MMAGWVCSKGAWSRIFNQPNLRKFSEPTIECVDFPRIALSEARWDGQALHVAAHAQNAEIDGMRTVVRVTNIGSVDNWLITHANGEGKKIRAQGAYLEVELIADNKIAVLHPE
jgi:hypothetical protein